MPAGVRTAMVLMIVGAAFLLLVGVVLVAAGGRYALLGVLCLGLGAMEIYLAVSVARANRTARGVAVALVAIGIASDLLSVPRNPIGSVVGIVLGALIIYLLRFQPEARRFFGDSP